MTLAGVGTAGSVLRAYVDDRFAQEAQVGRGRALEHGPRRRRRRGSTACASTSSPATARWRAGSRRRSSATIRTRRRRGPGRRAGEPAVDGRGRCTVQPGTQPLDFGAGALWFGCHVHPDLHRQPRADPRPGPDLSRADLRRCRTPDAASSARWPRRSPRPRAPAAGARSAGSRPTSGRRTSRELQVAGGRWRWWRCCVGQARDRGDAVVLQGGGRRRWRRRTRRRRCGYLVAAGPVALTLFYGLMRLARRRLRPAARRRSSPGSASGRCASWRSRPSGTSTRSACATTSPARPAGSAGSSSAASRASTSCCASCCSRSCRWCSSWCWSAPSSSSSSTSGTWSWWR